MAFLITSIACYVHIGNRSSVLALEWTWQPVQIRKRGFGWVKKENRAPRQISFQLFKGSVHACWLCSFWEYQSENSQTRLNISLKHREGATLSKDIDPEWSWELDHSWLGDLEPVALLLRASVSPRCKARGWASWSLTIFLSLKLK